MLSIKYFLYGGTKRRSIVKNSFIYYFIVMMCFYYYFTAKYIVQVPNVSAVYLQLLKPAFFINCNIFSPCGTAAMLSGKYEYALTSLDIILPTAGIIHLVYAL